MVHTIPLPILDDLLPPLLAHLPASFNSPQQPPPSLLPLLAPILRSRVQLLQDPSQDSWLPLLTWNGSNGSELVSHFTTLDLTPHPSSGELELGHATLKGIQRADEETLKASAELWDWGIVVVYVWCTNDPEGEDDGWRVLDVHTMYSADDSAQWHPSISAAGDAFTRARNISRTLVNPLPPTSVEKEEEEEDDDDDDDYWNMYNCSSVPTPAPREVANPPTEEEYFSRYSTVENSSSFSSETDSNRRDSMGGPSYSPGATTAISTPPILLSCAAPRPISSDSTKFSLSRLEESANHHHVQVEVAVKQHVSTSLKSLYRLAKAVGIGRDEFEAIVHTEVALLSMMDIDDE